MEIFLRPSARGLAREPLQIETGLNQSRTNIQTAQMPLARKMHGMPLSFFEGLKLGAECGFT